MYQDDKARFDRDFSSWVDRKAVKPMSAYFLFYTALMGNGLASSAPNASVKTHAKLGGSLWKVMESEKKVQVF